MLNKMFRKGLFFGIISSFVYVNIFGHIKSKNELKSPLMNLILVSD